MVHGKQEDNETLAQFHYGRRRDSLEKTARLSQQRQALEEYRFYQNRTPFRPSVVPSALRGMRSPFDTKQGIDYIAIEQALTVSDDALLLFDMADTQPLAHKVKSRQRPIDSKLIDRMPLTQEAIQ